MKRGRSRLGMTLLGTTVSAFLAIIVLGAGVRLTQTASDLSRSTDAGDTAARQTERAMVAFEDAIRSGSLAQFTRVNGSSFVTGTYDDGISGKRVLGYRGTPVLGARYTIWWAADASGTTGDVLRQQNGVTELIAHGVQRFRVSRNGNLFTVSVTSRVVTRGTWDRAVRGSSTVLPRNP